MTVQEEEANIPAYGLKTAEVAKRYRVGLDKVRSWIKSGELQAIDTSPHRCGRPRFIILPDAIADFENRRAFIKPRAERPKRRIQPKDIPEYF